MRVVAEFVRVGLFPARTGNETSAERVLWLGWGGGEGTILLCLVGWDQGR